MPWLGIRPMRGATGCAQRNPRVFSGTTSSPQLGADDGRVTTQACGGAREMIAAARTDHLDSTSFFSGSFAIASHPGAPLGTLGRGCGTLVLDQNGRSQRRQDAGGGCPLHQAIGRRGQPAGRVRLNDRADNHLPRPADAGCGRSGPAPACRNRGRGTEWRLPDAKRWRRSR